MRILLLTQIVPYPPDSGPKIKTYNVLRYLASKHDVHLVSFVRGPAEVANARLLAPLCAEVTTVPIRRSRPADAAYVVRSLFSGRPFLIERDDQPAMRAAVGETLRRHRFDAVHADQVSMAQYALEAPVALRVLDEHNAVWTIVRRSAERLAWPLRALAHLEWRKMQAYEGMLCRRFDLVTLVSADDRNALAQAARADFASITIPIAVDTDALPFEERGPDARHVVSVATMFYPPNVEGILWFAERSLPRVRQQTAGTQLFVVGSRPPRSVVALGEQQAGVVVTGYVEDLSPILRQGAVTIVPVHSGSGMRVKILEAFARGIPVVSTSVGVEGIAGAEPGVHLLVADDPLDFADAVVRLLREPDTAARIARAGRALVERNFDWRTALAGLDAVYPTGMRAAANT